MASPAWRYEVLDPAKFRVGDGPFRARGLAYAGALRYVDVRLAGGRPALLRAIGKESPFAGFYDQIFLVSGDYDISPLVLLLSAIAELAGVPVGQFIRERARWSGNSDTKGLWKPALHGPTPEAVASRLDFAFERYFPPCGANVQAARAGYCEGELRRLAACMNGLYAQSTVGFYEGALEGAGARDVRVHFERPSSDGAHAGVLLERVRFSVTWEQARA
jgi:hypothetical protein